MGTGYRRKGRFETVLSAAQMMCKRVGWLKCDSTQFDVSGRMTGIECIYVSQQMIN